MSRMPPSLRNTSGISSEPQNRTTAISPRQVPPPDRWLCNTEAISTLFIGSDSSVERVVRCLRRQRHLLASAYTSFELPSEGFLFDAGIISVLDVEDPRRMRQLAWCCKYRRKCGGPPFIFAYSCHMKDRDGELAMRVLDLGAIPLHLFEQ